MAKNKKATKTGTRFGWTKFRKGVRALMIGAPYIDDADFEPLTASEVFAFIEKSTRSAAKKDGRRESELAMALAEYRSDVIDVAKRVGVDASELERPTP